MYWSYHQQTYLHKWFSVLIPSNRFLYNSNLFIIGLTLSLWFAIMWIFLISWDKENNVFFQERLHELCHMTFGLLCSWRRAVRPVNIIFQICHVFYTMLNKESLLVSICKQVFNCFIKVFTCSVIFISALGIPPCSEWVHPLAYVTHCHMMSQISVWPTEMFFVYITPYDFGKF